MNLDSLFEVVPDGAYGVILTIKGGDPGNLQSVNTIRLDHESAIRLRDSISRALIVGEIELDEEFAYTDQMDSLRSMEDDWLP